MLVKNSRAWAPHDPLCYGYALLGVIVAFLARYQLHPLLESQFPVIFFLISTTLTAHHFGWRPAFFSAALGITIAYYFFIPPYNSFEIVTLLDLLNLFIYGVLFFTVIYLIEKLQRERYRAVLISRVCESRMLIMAKLSSKKSSSPTKGSLL